MAEKLFPVRQRCKTCAKKLGGEASPQVLFGLYCTAKCAGVAETIAVAQRAPRECVTQRDGAWVFKRRYRSESEIPARLREEVSANHYWCNNCGHLHIGHSRIDSSKETHRVFRDRADLADLLIKARGQAQLKQVAAVAKIRPIRIREWENPRADSPDFDALLALLRVYRMKPAVVFGSVPR